MYNRYNICQKKTRLKQFQCDNMIHIYSIPSQSLLTSPLSPKDFTSPKETLNMCVYYVCADLTSLAYMWYEL